MPFSLSMLSAVIGRQPNRERIRCTMLLVRFCAAIMVLSREGWRVRSRFKMR